MMAYLILLINLQPRPFCYAYQILLQEKEEKGKQNIYAVNKLLNFST